MIERRVIDFDDLLARARRGDADAASALCTQHAPLVRAVLRRRKPAFLRSECDTDDLVQSVFAEVLRGIGRIENRGRVAFRHLLCLKAECKVKQKVRSAARARRSRGERVGDEALDRVEAPRRDPLERAASADEAAAIADAVRRLDADARAVLRLRYEQGFPFDVIAHALGLPSAAAARMRHTRALARLRELLPRDRPERSPPPRRRRSS